MPQRLLCPFTSICEVYQSYNNMTDHERKIDVIEVYGNMAHCIAKKELFIDSDDFRNRISKANSSLEYGPECSYIEILKRTAGI